MMWKTTGAVARFLLVILLSASCAYGTNLRTGDEAYERGDYEQALAQYTAALQRKPDSAEAAERVYHAQQMVIGQHAARAQGALDVGDVLGALVETQRIWGRFPHEPATVRLVADVANATTAQAQQLHMDGDFANALMLYETLGRTLPTEAAGAEAPAAEVRAAWSESLRAGATRAYNAGHKSDALLQTAKIAQLTGANADLRQRNELYDEVVRAWTYWIELDGSGAAFGAAARDLGRGFGSAAIVATEQVPSNVEASARLRINASKLRFRTSQSVAYRTVQYQSGTQLVENHHYFRLQDRVLDEERRLVDYENEVSRREVEVSRAEQRLDRARSYGNSTTSEEYALNSARSDLDRARRNVVDQRNNLMRAKEDVAREPQYYEEPVYADHVFEVVTHTREATMPVTVVLEHADRRGAIVVEQTLTAHASDETHAPQPIAGVAGDPLTLPDDSVLGQRIDATVAEIARAVVRDSFDGWRAGLLNQAASSPSEGASVNKLVSYIMTDPSNVAPEVATKIAALRGIPDAVTLLSR